MTKETICCSECCLGIELGSTRIKAVLIDSTHAPVAMGVHDWENRLENGVWTYHMAEIPIPARRVSSTPYCSFTFLRRSAKAS